VFDGYWEFYVNPWDVCAGILIVQEAGGTVTGSALKEWSFSDELIVASNGAIHQELFNQINSITQKK
ncbi:MAG TPA: inositol monophosphatase family protein, partial [Candidatus Cloacimonadota bacterium]|nr:inositol monophosphatase family protein [Candidatus Cloacimonadota bacterium]